MTGIPSAADAAGPSLAGPSKGLIRIVHVYPREMSIYGDLGNTRALAWRARRHGYDVEVLDHHPGAPWPRDAHLLMGGGGQDSGQARVEEDLAANAATLRALAADGVPMLMICGMYQLFGNAFVTVEGLELPGLGILDVTTRGRTHRMIGRVVVDSPMGVVVGYENHSGATTLGPGQQPFARVRVGHASSAASASTVAASASATATMAPMAPKEPCATTSSAATSMDRSCRRTPRSPTGSSGMPPRSPPVGNSSLARSTTPWRTRRGPVRSTG